MKLYLSVFILVVFAVSCKESTIQSPLDLEISETDHPNFVSDIEAAHNKSEIFKHEVICYNLDLTFGTRNSKMKIFTTPNTSAIRVDKSNGVSTIMLDGAIYTNADSTDWNREKFGVYTYQYFFMAPYKFSDKGTVWKKLEPMEMLDSTTNRAMLTFETGTGDAPDDWYIVHSDQKTNMVNYIGYIVTGGGASIEEAEKSAHAIGYTDYQHVSGIPIAQKWGFYNYKKTDGLGDKIGEATIENVIMMDNVDQFSIALTDDYTKI